MSIQGSSTPSVTFVTQRSQSASLTESLRSLTFFSNKEDEEMSPYPEANPPNDNVSDTLSLSSEDLPSVEELLDDAGAKQQAKIEERQEGYCLRNVGLYVGLQFDNYEEARTLITRTIIERGESYSIRKSRKDCYVLVCKEVHCDFRIRVSGKINPKITILRPHTCGPATHLEFRPAHAVAYLAPNHQAAVLDNRSITPRQIQSNERIQHLNQVSYKQSWRTKEKIKQRLDGEERRAFEKIPALLDHVSRARVPEQEGGAAYTKVHRTYLGQFEYFIIVPAASRHAFARCRKVLFLDACHTKSRYPLCLFAAASIDGNGKTITLGFGLFNTESEYTWSTFIRGLVIGLALTIEHMDSLVVISDRDKGLLPAVKKYLPGVPHLHCCQHLADNVQHQFGTAARKVFWSLAEASTELKFNQALQKLEQEINRGVEAAAYLRAIDPSRWAKYAVTAQRYGHNTSNVIEGVFSKLEDIRKASVLNLISLFWRKIMIQYHTGKTLHKDWPFWTEYARSQLNVAYQRSREYWVYPSEIDPIIAQVCHMIGGGTHIVRLPKIDSTTQPPPDDNIRGSRGFCDCLELQDRGIPCRHVLAVCRDYKLNPEDYLSKYYSLNTYKDLYKLAVAPISVAFEDLTPDPDCRAPVIKPKMGRRRHRRMRKGDRNKKKRTCSHCGKEGHNRLTCRERAAVEERMHENRH